VYIYVEHIDQNNLRCGETLHIGRLDDVVQKILLALDYCVHSDLEQVISKNMIRNYYISIAGQEDNLTAECKEEMEIKSRNIQYKDKHITRIQANYNIKDNIE
jgi:hypothetical protein